jgi:hypothetical protein
MAVANGPGKMPLLAQSGHPNTLNQCPLSEVKRTFPQCTFIVDLEERSVELLPGQGFVVPKGVMHCMVETAAIVPTGDA